MSETDDDCETFSLFPDISKEYQKWMNTDISEFMPKHEANAVPLGKDGNVAETQSKRRKLDTPSKNEEQNNDVIELYDTSSNESTRQLRSTTRSRSRGRGRGRARGRRSNKRNTEAAPVITNEIPVVVEDSDVESAENVNNVSLEFPDELENYEMSVKVIWKSKDIHRFKIRKCQKMKSIFNFFKDLEGVSEDRLLFMLDDRRICPDDTPDSLKLTVVDFIDGGVTPFSASETPAIMEEEPNDEDLELKILCKDKRKPLTVKIQKGEKMKILMIKVAEMLEMPREKLKFTFDGELLNSSETPADLELEGGECIEVNVIA